MRAPLGVTAAILALTLGGCLPVSDATREAARMAAYETGRRTVEKARSVNQAELQGKLSDLVERARDGGVDDARIATELEAAAADLRTE